MKEVFNWWSLSFYFFLIQSDWCCSFTRHVVCVRGCGVFSHLLLHVRDLLIIGQRGFGQVWAFWVEKRELPSGEEKNLVRREVFSGYGGCRPKFGRMVVSFFVQWLAFRGCREIMPNGHSSSFRCLRFWGVSAKVRPNGHLLLCLFVRCRVSFLLLFLWCC